MNSYTKSLAALFTLLAVSGCKTEEGIAVIIPKELTCSNQAIDQSFQMKPNDSFYYFTGNSTVPYYELARIETNKKIDGAITVKNTTETTIRLYEQDRWLCHDDAGVEANYKDFERNSRLKYYKIENH